jgi:hypothetical protein
MVDAVIELYLDEETKTLEKCCTSRFGAIKWIGNVTKNNEHYFAYLKDGTYAEVCGGIRANQVEIPENA